MTDIGKDATNVNVIIVAETQQQRIAFTDTVKSLGLTMLDCIAPHEIKEKQLKAKADIWLVDSQYDDNLYNKIYGNELYEQTDGELKTVLVGFSKAPYLNETDLYAKWQRKLKRKLANILEIPELLNTNLYREKLQPWRFVILLGASMGGPSAVKAFLDHVDPDLPVTFLLAQHFNNNMLHTLPRILNRHNGWRCQIVAISQTMQTGQCLIAPIEQKIVCDSTGRVILLKDAWQGEYKPSIGELLKNASDAFGSDLISVIFSGMGDDGSQYLNQIQGNNSQLWVQEPASSTCASQPRAIIESGYSDFVGTPEALANHLNEYVLRKMKIES